MLPLARYNSPMRTHSSLAAIALALSLADCGDSGGSNNPEEAQDFEMQAGDFDCILEWEKVRKFRITNKLGRIDEALEVANSPDGGIYPPGTVIQLFPGEAMAKRQRGWDPATNDWEFFALQATSAGTEILTRGAAETVNQFGGNCFSCHAKAEPQWDFVCETGRGCDPLPDIVNDDFISLLQQGDPRCGR